MRTPDRVFYFLLWAGLFLAGAKEAGADGFVTVHPSGARGIPKVFIVGEDGAGKEIRVSVGEGKTPLPERTQLEIAYADAKSPITVQGKNIEINILAGSPLLSISGDAHLLLSNQVSQVRILSETGSATVVIGGKTLALPPGNLLEVTNDNQQHRFILLHISPLPRGEVPISANPNSAENTIFALSQEETELLDFLSSEKEAGAQESEKDALPAPSSSGTLSKELAGPPPSPEKIFPTPSPEGTYPPRKDSSLARVADNDAQEGLETFLQKIKDKTKVSPSK